jgi:hypothetical protein
MCPLLVPASKNKRLLFFSFFVAAAIDSTTEANKAPLSSLSSLDVYGHVSLSLSLSPKNIAKCKHCFINENVKNVDSLDGKILGPVLFLTYGPKWLLRLNS